MTNFKKLPISAVMVIYNEEKVLERALKSFCDLVDEIVIVHDGKCTDKSLEIAKKYTENIFELEHVGEAEKHRPFTYEKAKNDWILQVDGDEHLSDDLRDSLENMTQGETDIYEASYTVYRQYYLFSKRVFFRKSKIYFIGIPHEAPMPLNKKTKIKKVDAEIMHKPLYDNCSLQVFRKKWIAWAKIHARSLLQDFREIPKWNCLLTDWETRRKQLIRHPFLLGMLGATAFRAFSYLGLFFQYRKTFLIKMGIISTMYTFCLYRYVWKYKKQKQSQRFA